MKVALEKSFEINAPVADCWELLSDIPRLTTCMPGASITRVIDASHFAGSVAVNVGPMRLQFAGELELMMIDAFAHTLVLLAKGVDKKGSSATMQLRVSLLSHSKQSTTLQGQAEVTVNGQLAQLGSRMIGPISEVILSQFADQFRQQVAELSGTSAPLTAPDNYMGSQSTLNVALLLWASAKRALCRLWGKSDTPSLDVKK